jgi:hypothetical protein
MANPNQPNQNPRHQGDQQRGGQQQQGNPRPDHEGGGQRGGQDKPGQQQQQDPSRRDQQGRR